jgi:hypothetical protein
LHYPQRESEGFLVKQHFFSGEWKMRLHACLPWRLARLRRAA